MTRTPKAADLFGEFTTRESRIVVAFERAAGPLYDSLDCADTNEAYAVMSQQYGVVQTLDACRRNRFYLAELGDCVESLGEQLREGAAELSIAAAMFLDAQTSQYQTKKAGIERCLLDALLGPVKQ
ncbi:hypothetical protein GCM10009827_083790 [Dactylosporangium maewongense]|uniref:Transcriptional regulator n=1 Tax=Dactylosporangium maewongense TaxID=634393 RepID=A0ABN2C309_9ACTN